MVLQCWIYGYWPSLLEEPSCLVEWYLPTVRYILCIIIDFLVNGINNWTLKVLKPIYDQVQFVSFKWRNLVLNWDPRQFKHLARLINQNVGTFLAKFWQMWLRRKMWVVHHSCHNNIHFPTSNLTIILKDLQVGLINNGSLKLDDEAKKRILLSENVLTEIMFFKWVRPYGVMKMINFWKECTAAMPGTWIGRSRFSSRSQQGSSAVESTIKSNILLNICIDNINSSDRGIVWLTISFTSELCNMSSINTRVVAN